MPHNDLLPFDRLEPEGTLMPVAKGGKLTQKTVTSWPEAVKQLWLTPIPRVIVVTGGTKFNVAGGEDLQIKATTVANGQARCEIFRIRDDEDPEPMVDKNQDWKPVKTVAESYETDPFWCQLVSMRTPALIPIVFPTPLNTLVQPFHYATGVGDGTCVAEPEARTMLRFQVTDATRTADKGTVSVYNGKANSTGNLTARVWSEIGLTGAGQMAVFNRISGGDVLTITPNWLGMSYGWTVGDPATEGRILH